MIKLIKNLLLFSIVLLLFSVICTFLFNNVIMHNSMIVQNDRHLYSYPDEINYLFFGDSHVKNAVNPDLIDNSFNFSSTKENYIQTYYKLKYFLENSPKSEYLTHILLPYDLSSFSTYRLDDLVPTFYWSKYVDLFEVGQILGERPKYFMKFLEAKLFSFYNNGSYIFEYIGWKFFKGGKIVPQINGFTPKNGDFSQIDNLTEYTEKRTQKLFKNSELVDKNLFLYFEKCIEISKKYGKKLILIEFPVSREHHNSIMELFPNTGNDEQIIKKYKTDNDIIIINFRDEFFDQNHLFHDPAHLNERGAKIFSELLMNRIEKVDL